MRKAAVWALGVAGLAGIVMALGVEYRRDPQGSSFRIGWPDAWVEWDSGPQGFSWQVNYLRWSVGLLVAGVYAIYYAARLGRRKATAG